MSKELKTNDVVFAKVKEEAIIPSKREEDAGFDIYPCFENDAMVIRSHETAKVPTGIISAFDSSKVAILKERGSTGTKGIGQRAGIIDSGYRGEWLVPITNHTDKPIVIAKEGSVHRNTEYGNVTVYPYEKAICQAIFFEVPKLHVEELSAEEVQAISSERGDGKLGSSGK